MLTYLNTVWAGDAAPFWPHFVLLSLSVLAGIAVAAGIIFESPRYPSSVHRIAIWLVISGVAVESFCTISLFVFDERISLAQQDKIADLEQKLAARVLGAKQLSNLKATLARYSGQTFEVIPYWDDEELLHLGQQIADALTSANWVLDQPARFTMLAGVIAGVVVHSDKAAPSTVREAATMLVSALNGEGIAAKAQDSTRQPAKQQNRYKCWDQAITEESPPSGNIFLHGFKLTHYRSLRFAFSKAN